MSGRAVRLEGPLTIAQAGAIAATLRRRKRDILLHLDGVERVDASFLQLVCASHRSAASRGARFEVTGPGRVAVIHAARLAGLVARTCPVGLAGDCPLRERESQ